MIEKCKSLVAKVKTSNIAQKVEEYKVGIFCSCTMASMAIANSPVLASSWAGFKASMDQFFRNGLGGDGLTAVGGALLAIGVVGAGVSFVVHKFNPQSRMPGWITCLIIGLLGSVLMMGLDPFIRFFENVRNLIFGWIGI